MAKQIKKYTNRRLYDTEESHYITLDELAALIRGGEDVEVVDAKSGKDLTQATLAQIVVESRGAARLLPVPLLTQMIRMEDDALAEFMSLYLTWSLDIYYAMKRSRNLADPYSEFMDRYTQMATLPLNMARGSLNFVKDRLDKKRDDDVDELREEIKELKDLIKEITPKRKT